MEKNQPNEELSPEDKEYEEIAKKIPGLNEEKEEKKEDSKTEDKTEEEEEEKEEPAKKTDSEKKQDKEDSEGEEDEEEDPKPKRPEKYIPIKQYTDEKKQWRETEESYKKRIGDLEKIANTSDRGSRISDDKIKAYAEKHKLELNVAQAELERVRDAQDLLNDKGEERKQPTELDEDTKARLEEADAMKAEQMFNKEFNDLAVPEIKELWPNATEKQLKEAKALVEKKATTKEFIHSDLNYVVYKSQKELAAIFENKKGPENGNRATEKGKSEFRASDFKDGKTSFATLSELSSEEQTKIVEDMDVQTYEKYCRWIEQNDTLNINRGGKKIKF